GPCRNSAFRCSKPSLRRPCSTCCSIWSSSTAWHGWSAAFRYPVLSPPLQRLPRPRHERLRFRHHPTIVGISVSRRNGLYAETDSAVGSRGLGTRHLAGHVPAVRHTSARGGGGRIRQFAARLAPDSRHILVLFPGAVYWRVAHRRR